MVVHTEQRFNTDHAGSVVLLLGQKQLFQDCLLGLHTAQFMVALVGTYGEHQFLAMWKCMEGKKQYV